MNQVLERPARVAVPEFLDSLGHEPETVLLVASKTRGWWGWKESSEGKTLLLLVCHKTFEGIGETLDAHSELLAHFGGRKPDLNSDGEYTVVQMPLEEAKSLVTQLSQTQGLAIFEHGHIVQWIFVL